MGNKRVSIQQQKQVSRHIKSDPRANQQIFENREKQNTSTQTHA